MTTDNHTKTATATDNARLARMAIIVGLILLAFFTSYRLAAARNGEPQSTAKAPTPAASVLDAGTGGAGGTGGAACACCGGAGGTGETIEGAAATEADGVQRISVDASNGYNPNVIKLAAGVPAEITFANGQGCLGQVMSKDLGFFEDLTTGPKTVKLQPLPAGEYGFSCGMEMVFGTIVVQ